MIEDDMYNEIEEELGIQKKDITILSPIAICREMARAGKPQIFFAGFVNIGHDKIMNNIDRARAKMIEKVKNVEFLEYPIFGIRNLSHRSIFGEIVKRSESARVGGLTGVTMGMTTECAANLYYAALAFPSLILMLNR